MDGKKKKVHAIHIFPGLASVLRGEFWSDARYFKYHQNQKSIMVRSGDPTDHSVEPSFWIDLSDEDR